MPARTKEREASCLSGCFQKNCTKYENRDALKEASCMYKCAGKCLPDHKPLVDAVWKKYQCMAPCVLKNMPKCPQAMHEPVDFHSLSDECVNAMAGCADQCFLEAASKSSLNNNNNKCPKRKGESVAMMVITLVVVLLLGIAGGYFLGRGRNLNE